MMGHIHNLLLNMVKRHHGDEGVRKLFELSGLPMQKFRHEEIYPEEQWQALYRGTKQLYGVDDDGAQKAFSDYFMEVSPKMFPAIFEEAGNARSLLERVPTIHKQWPTAASSKGFKAKLFILLSEKKRLVFKYDSPNRLCGVLRYVAEGVLTYYGESGKVSEIQCTKKGAPWCEVEIRFTQPTSKS